VPDRAAPACAAAGRAGRRLPAALLVVLAAVASLLGSPTAAAQAQPSSRPVVGGTPVTAARLPLAAARQHGSRDATLRRTSRDRSVIAGALGMVDRVASAASQAAGPAGPAPSPAILAALLVLGLAVIGRVAAAAGDGSAPGRVPSGLRGRAPPAYVLA
jgi:hypothetical protein